MGWRERFLTSICHGLIAGITFGDLLRLLAENGFRVSPGQWPKVVFTAACSLISTPLRWLEYAAYHRRIAAQTVPPPVFVLGHYRSGTTHLDNLLSVDRRFNFPRVSQVMIPHTFLLAEPVFVAAAKILLPPTRYGVDNMAFHAGAPLEEELALLVLTFMSPLLAWAFPDRADHYHRYLTFRNASPDEVERWKAAYMFIIRKLTLGDDRPLVLKSPPNTGRIRLLLEMFPEARFVHIHRDPYVVYQSTEQMVRANLGFMAFHPANPGTLQDGIIQQYQTMYDVFFEEKTMVPPGRFCEVAFEDLESDPVGRLRSIYEELSLPDFAETESALKQYVWSLTGYRKNAYPDLSSELQSEISGAWRRSFDEWGYRR